MKTVGLNTFEPRKTPVQRRSTVTVEAISEATVQVLQAVGLDRLTTTRVAERAGVSVGTLYQYDPNQQALLYAVLKVDSSKVAEAVEGACRANRGAAVKVLVAAVVEAFVNAKLEPHGRIDAPVCGRLRTARGGNCATVGKARASSADDGMGRGCGCNVGRDGVCSANTLFGDCGGDTFGVGGWCIGDDGSSVAPGVAGALPGVCG